MKMSRFFICLALCFCLLQVPAPLMGTVQPVLVEYELLTPVPISKATIDYYIDIIAAMGFDFSTLKQNTRFDVNVYRVTYKTYHRGKEVLASGAVVVPVTEEVHAIASYQRGTIVRDQDAPSQFISMFMPQTVLNWGIITASSGFICAAPDFLGFGASRDIFHPYHFSFSAGITGVNMLRATKEFLADLGVPFKNEFFLFGFSEGGYTTLAMQRQIQLFHRNEIPIVATAPGGGMYDLYHTVEYYLSSPTMASATIPSFILQTHQGIYQPYRNLEDYFSAPYAQRLEEGLLASELLFTDIEAQLSLDPNELFNPQFLNSFLGNGEWFLKAALKMNDLYWGWAPRDRTRFYHGTADNIVPYLNLEKVEEKFGHLPNVEFAITDGADHYIGYFTWITEVIPWFLSL